MRFMAVFLAAFVAAMILICAPVIWAQELVEPIPGGTAEQVQLLASSGEVEQPPAIPAAKPVANKTVVINRIIKTVKRIVVNSSYERRSVRERAAQWSAISTAQATADLAADAAAEKNQKRKEGKKMDVLWALLAVAVGAGVVFAARRDGGSATATATATTPATTTPVTTTPVTTAPSADSQAGAMRTAYAMPAPPAAAGNTVVRGGSYTGLDGRTIAWQSYEPAPPPATQVVVAVVPVTQPATATSPPAEPAGGGDVDAPPGSDLTVADPSRPGGPGTPRAA